MSKYRSVQVIFWQDAFVLDLTPEEKYFYIYLMTNSKANQIGIYELPKRIIETETGYNRESVEKLLNRFVDYKKIIYNKPTNEIMLLNWSKHNWNNSPKVVKRVEEELKNVKYFPFIQKYRETVDTIDKNTVSIQYPYSMDIREKEKEKEKEKRKKDISPKQVYDESNDYFILASQLYKMIKTNNVNFKTPNLQNWSNDMRLIVERDERTLKQVSTLIDWSQRNDFWHRNILSPQSLRKHWDKLVLQWKAENKKVKGHVTLPTQKPKEFILDISKGESE